MLKCIVKYRQLNLEGSCCKSRGGGRSYINARKHHPERRSCYFPKGKRASSFYIFIYMAHASFSRFSFRNMCSIHTETEKKIHSASQLGSHVTTVSRALALCTIKFEKVASQHTFEDQMKILSPASSLVQMHKQSCCPKVPEHVKLRMEVRL